MRAIPTAAVNLVAKWEGLELAAYPDPATGGDPWTIGYGHTLGVKRGDLINEAQARAFLRKDLEIAAERIEQRIGAVVDELTENQYAALLSFVFNVGADPKWTIWKRLKARQFDQIPGELIKFTNAAGKRLQGLVNRRTDEIRTWTLDEPGSDDIRLTSATTRGIDTPPTVVDTTPPQKSVTIWGQIMAALATAATAIMTFLGNIPGWVKDALNVINPFSDNNPIVQNLAMGLSTLAAVTSVILLARTWGKKQERRN